MPCLFKLPSFSGFIILSVVRSNFSPVFIFFCWCQFCLLEIKSEALDKWQWTTDWIVMWLRSDVCEIWNSLPWSRDHSNISKGISNRRFMWEQHLPTFSCWLRSLFNNTNYKKIPPWITLVSDLIYGHFGSYLHQQITINYWNLLLKLTVSSRSMLQH